MLGRSPRRRTTPPGAAAPTAADPTPLALLDGNVPAGPPHPPPIDAAVVRDVSFQAGAADAQAGVHDADTLAHQAPLLYAHDVDAQHQQWRALATDLRVNAQQVAGHLKAIKDGVAIAAMQRLAAGERAAAAAEEAQWRAEAVLRGAGVHAGSPYADPTRISETRRATLVKTWLPLAVLAAADLGINVLALQVLGGGLVELISFALVLGLSNVAAGYWAGAHARAHRNPPGRHPGFTRWAIPALLTALTLAVVAFVATLRLAFVAAPVIDPTTGAETPALLTAAGTPAAVVWAGVAALQLIFYTVAALHAHATHNPVLTELQRARREAPRWRAPLPQLHQDARTAAQAAIEADTDRRRVEDQFTAHEAWLQGLATQAKVIYGRAYARTAANPEITVEMEARLAREAPATPTGRTLVPPAHTNGPSPPPGQRRWRRTLAPATPAPTNGSPR